MMLTDIIFASLMGVGLVLFLILWVTVRPAGSRSARHRRDVRIQPR